MRSLSFAERCRIPVFRLQQFFAALAVKKKNRCQLMPTYWKLSLLFLFFTIKPLLGNKPASFVNGHHVTAFYLITSDYSYNQAEYTTVVNTIGEIQAWYQVATGGMTFQLGNGGNPIIVNLPNNSSYYAQDYWGNILNDLGNLGYNVWQPENIKLLFIKGGGGVALGAQWCGVDCGVAMIGMDLFPQFNTGTFFNCPPGNGVSAWPCTPVGAAAHELGHCFGLPHPADVPSTSASAGHSLMQTHWNYPYTYAPPGESPWGLLTIERQTLRSNPFFYQGIQTLQPYEEMPVLNLPNQGPTPNAGFTYTINGLTVNFNNTSTGANLFYWTFSDGTVSNQTNPSYTLPGYGTYTVRLRASNANGMMDMAEMEISACNLNTSISASDTDVCPGETITIQASGGGSYLWSNGMNASSITLSISATTTFSVTISDGLGCMEEESITINALPEPVPSITATADAVCLGESTTLQASGGNTFLWNTGETASSITVSPTNTSTFSVQVTNSAGCTASATKNITVNPLPQAAVSASQPTICVGETVVLSGSGGTSFLWSTGENSPEITVSPTNTTTYGLEVTDASGCSGQTSIEVVVNPVPMATIAASSTEVCPNTSVTLSAGGGGSYLWSTGETGPQIQATITQEESFSVSATNSFGCTTEESITITTLPEPVPSITATADAVCLGESTTLQVSGGNTFLWNTGETASSITVSPNSTSTFSVQVTNSAGCTASATKNITVNPLPQAAVSASQPTICVGETVVLSGSGGTSFLWSTGENSPEITVSPTNTTTYGLEVTDASGCSGQTSIEVVVNPVPMATIAASSTEVCPNTSVILSAGGGSYLWSTGETGPQIQATITQEESFSVSVTNSFGCTQENTISIGTFALIDISLSTSPYEICVGDLATIQLSGDTSFVDNVLWSTGATENHITISPDSTSSFSAEVTDNNGCVQVLEDSVIVYVPEIITLETQDDTICLGETTMIQVKGGSNYLWNTGASGAAIQISPSQSTVYSVTVTDNNGCDNFLDKEVIVLEPATFEIISSGDSICIGQEVILSASGGESFLWSTGDTAKTIVLSPTETASYLLDITDQNGCLINATKEVVVFPLPDIQISLSAEPVCSGESVTATATGGIEYHWSTGDQGASTLIEVIDFVDFTVTVTNGFGCIDSLSSEASSYPQPDLFISLSQDSICQGDTITLQSSVVNAESYLWETGDTTIAITYPFYEDTAISLSIVDVYQCAYETETSVIVRPEPEFQFSGSSVLCEGESIEVGILPEFESYFWSTGCNTQQCEIAEPGTIGVTVIDGFGCDNHQSLEIVQIDSLQIEILGEQDICNGEETILSVSDDYPDYVWSTGETSNSIIVDTTGVYSVSVTGSSGCQGQAATQVTLFPLPVFSFEEDTLVFCSNTTVLIEGPTGMEEYSWSTGDTLSSIEIGEPGTYSLTVVDDNLCRYSDSLSAFEQPVPAFELEFNNLVIIPVGLNSNEDYSFYWSNGEVTESLLVDSSGSYCLTVTDTYGCSSTSCIETVINETETLHEQHQVKVYPNPLSEFLIIEIPESELATISVFNAVGQKIHHGEKKIFGRMAIDFSQFDAGVYLIVISLPDKEFTQKLIKVY